MYFLYDDKSLRVFSFKAGEHDHDEILKTLDRTVLSKPTKLFIDELLKKMVTEPKTLFDLIVEESLKNPEIQVFLFKLNKNYRFFP